MHNHYHSCCNCYCIHCLHYCSCCNVVYCCKCGQQLGQNWYYYSPLHFYFKTAGNITTATTSATTSSCSHNHTDK